MTKLFRYESGAANISKTLETNPEEAKALVGAYRARFPDIAKFWGYIKSKHEEESNDD